jgi:uncharacterized membrane protein
MTTSTRSVKSSTSLLPWLILLLIGVLLAIGFFAMFAFPYLLLDSEVMARFEGRTAWIFTHVASGSIALFVGAPVLWMGAKRKSMSLHRKLGMVYLATVSISSITSFYLALTTEVNWVFGAGLFGLGCAWVITTGLGFIAIKRRLIQQHMEWMIRSYVVTFGFVFFRILVGILTALEVGTLFERLTAASWFCWAFPLLFTEAIIQGRKILVTRVGAQSFS